MDALPHHNRKPLCSRAATAHTIPALGYTPPALQPYTPCIITTRSSADGPAPMSGHPPAAAVGPCTATPPLPASVKAGGLPPITPELPLPLHSVPGWPAPAPAARASPGAVTETAWSPFCWCWCCCCAMAATSWAIRASSHLREVPCTSSASRLHDGARHEQRTYTAHYAFTLQASGSLTSRGTPHADPPMHACTTARMQACAHADDSVACIVCTARSHAQHGVERVHLSPLPLLGRLRARALVRVAVPLGGCLRGSRPGAVLLPAPVCPKPFLPAAVPEAVMGMAKAGWEVGGREGGRAKAGGGGGLERERGQGVVGAAGSTPCRSSGLAYMYRVQP